MLYRIEKIVLFGIIFVGLLSCSKTKNNSDIQQDNAELIDPRDLDPADIAAYDREESEPFMNMPLGDCDILTVSKSNDSLSTKDLFHPGVLYVRYSQYACGDCITFVNTALVEYTSQAPSQKVIYLIKDIEMRDLHVWESKLGKRFEIYKVDSMPTDFDEGLTPYLFKLDDSLKVCDYYIPRKELPDSLQNYLYPSSEADHSL